jgi:hypothetical protein
MTHPMTLHEVRLMNTAVYKMRKEVTPHLKSHEAVRLFERMIEDFCATFNEEVAQNIPIDEAGALAQHHLKSLLKRWNVEEFDRSTKQEFSLFMRMFRAAQLKKDRQTIEEFSNAIRAALKSVA